jgi:hypothetical protein
MLGETRENPGTRLKIVLAKRFKWEDHSIKISKTGSLGGTRKWSQVEEPVMYHLRNSSGQQLKTPAGRPRDADSLKQG